MLNLVIGLLRYGSAKITPGFERRRLGRKPHNDIPEKVPHLELVLKHILTVSAELRFLKEMISAATY